MQGSPRIGNTGFARSLGSKQVSTCFADELQLQREVKSQADGAEVSAFKMSTVLKLLYLLFKVDYLEEGNVLYYRNVYLGCCG